MERKVPISPNFLTWAFAVGMALRVAWAVAVPMHPISDSAAYDAFAWNIVNYGVYGWAEDQPSAYWAVGAPAMAAATYYAFGDTYWGIVATNLATSGLIMILIYHIGSIYFSRDVGAIALAMVAFWPNLIYFTSILSSELYFVALMLGGLFFWARREGSSWLNLVLAGLIWGLACYVRPVILLFPIALTIAAFSQGLHRSFQTAVKAIVAVVLIVATVSPWSMRNERVLGERFLVSSNFSANLWMGNNPDSNGGYMALPEAVKEMSESERAAYLKSEVVAYILSDPIQYLKNSSWRVWKMHDRETIGVVWNEVSLADIAGRSGTQALKMISTAYWYLIVLMASAGLAYLFRHFRFAALFHPVFGGWAYFTTVHAMIVTQDRYHMPGSPFLTLLSAVLIVRILERFSLLNTSPPRLRNF